MGSGPTQIGATTAATAYAAAAGRARSNLAEAAADRMHGAELRAIQPVADPFPVRDQVRDQVLADRGLDRIALRKLGPLARLEAEISVDNETARRLRPVRATANFVDIRV